MFHLIKKLMRVDGHHHPIDRIANINSLVTGIALYPQLFKIIYSHSIGDLSMATFLIIFLTNIIWHFYGWHRRTLPVIFSSALNLLASCAILFLITIFHFS
ncbi:hypothetical protein KKF59_00155 [Patescibacteria group bacterium]|nr:hypothetical protein [Patescibacteria group bacterium]MBU1629734.1 hypothetical protein [Patescibacteria group bacterium]MBU1907530.1 hypothetical protein [Patescibacteria group bacterium]